MLLSGAAPLSSHVEEFLRVTFGSTLAQGYGIVFKSSVKKWRWIVLCQCDEDTQHRIILEMVHRINLLRSPFYCSSYMLIHTHMWMHVPY